MVNVFHKSDHAGKLVSAHKIHFHDSGCDLGRKRRVGIKKFLRCDQKIITDVEKGAHTGKRFLVFNFVDVAGA